MSKRKTDDGRRPPKRLWSFTFTDNGVPGFYGMLCHTRAKAKVEMKINDQWQNRRLVSFTRDQ